MRCFHVLFLLLGCLTAALLVSGCQDGAVRGGGVTLLCYDVPFNLQLTNADWVAFRDGEGDWQAIQPDATGTYNRTVNDPRGRYGFAIAANGRLQVLYATRAEMPVVPFYLPMSQGSTRDLNLPLSRDFTRDTALGRPRADVPARALGNQVTLSGVISYDFPAGICGVSVSDLELDGGPVTDFAFDLLPGVYDVVVGDLTHPKAWLHIDRNVAVNGNTVFNPALTASNTAQLEPGYTMNVIGGAEASGLVDFITANGTLFMLTAGDEATVPYNGIPAATRVDGDLYLFVGFDRSDEGDMLRTWQYTADPALTTEVVIPPSFDELEVSYATAGDQLLPTFDGLSYPGARLYRLLTMTNSGMTLCYVTAGWLAAGEATGVPFPDLSGVDGWQAAWGLPTGMAAVYGEVYAGTATPAGALEAVFSGVPALPDGTTLTCATRSVYNGN